MLDIVNVSLQITSSLIASAFMVYSFRLQKQQDQFTRHRKVVRYRRIN